MLGDKYQVFTSSGSYTKPEGTFDSWREAKEVRNDRFFMDDQVQSAWIMRSNPGLDLRQDKYGHTLRKDKHAQQIPRPEENNASDRARLEAAEGQQGGEDPEESSKRI